MSYEQQLKARLEELKERGMTSFHIDKGEKWNTLTREERCKELLNVLDSLEDIQTLNDRLIVAECSVCHALLTRDKVKKHEHESEKFYWLKKEYKAEFIN